MLQNKLLTLYFELKRVKNAIVEYLDCQIHVNQLKVQKGNGDMQAVNVISIHGYVGNRNLFAPPTLDHIIWLCGATYPRS